MPHAARRMPKEEMFCAHSSELFIGTSWCSGSDNDTAHNIISDGVPSNIIVEDMNIEHTSYLRALKMQR